MVQLHEPPAPQARPSVSSLHKARRVLSRTLLRSFRVPPIFLPNQNKTLVQLPIRIRPAFLCLTVLVLVCLALLGFHPTLSGKIMVHDKIQRRLASLVGQEPGLWWIGRLLWTRIGQRLVLLDV